jgi:hypothetical protein
MRSIGARKNWAVAISIVERISPKFCSGRGGLARSSTMLCGTELLALDGVSAYIPRLKSPPEK